ncbi:MAG: carboxylesterase/lipase family protein [Caulobacter sp.]
MPSQTTTRRTAITAGLALAIAPGLARADAPVLTTAGPVRGLLEEGLHVFRGLRYGARPARFEPPRPPPRWRDPAPAAAFGPASPQRGREPNQDEDCLFLNVWTPGLDAGRRPVMVYIHGGAYATGSGSDPLYDGAALARRGDVVVVTLNHRLGPLGYLYLGRLGPDAPDAGNAGMLDLVLALRWVQANIAGFGGDPRKVILFGQSGGGAKIATLMAMPVAKGLFHRAATMSGQQLTVSGPGNAHRRTLALLQALKLSPAEAGQLRTLPWQAIVEAAGATDPVIGQGALYFGPVLDERSLTRHPFYPDAPAQSAGIPMLIGGTKDETRNLIGGRDPGAFNLTWEDLPDRLAREMRVDIDPKLVINTYRGLYPDRTPSDIFFAATTASRSWRAGIVEAELRAAQGSPAHVYQLDWQAPADGGKWGAPHMLDIPLVFGSLAAPGSLTGTGAEARRVSEAMMDAFIAFARNGHPGHAGLPAWPPYSLRDRETMIVDAQCRVENDPRGAERRLFEKVPFIQQGT